MPRPLITRFAPSPSGYLHLGHAYSALLNHDETRRQGGKFRLRIENIDHTRCSPAFEDAIREDLDWLRIEADGEVLRQSERMGIYEEARSRLEGLGLLYRCFRTRAELAETLRAPHGSDERRGGLGPLAPDEEQEKLAQGVAFAWRLDLKASAEHLGTDSLKAVLVGETGIPHERAVAFTEADDPVIARKDIPTSYHLACTVDDAAQGVTLVWRGEDLADALSTQVLLLQLLDLPVPSYRHHPLVLDESGRRLAKRDRAATLRALREGGATPNEVRRRLGLPPAP